MAKGRLAVWVLAIMVIQTIVTGNFRPVIGKRELLGDTAGSWNIENDVGGSITVHCYDQRHDLGSAILGPTQVWFRQWQIDPTFSEVFTCGFSWDSSSGSMQQSFTIWGPYDPSSYLYTCSRCQWKVQPDGFYFQQADGQFVREWEWIPCSGCE